MRLAGRAKPRNEPRLKARHARIQSKRLLSPSLQRLHVCLINPLTGSADEADEGACQDAREDYEDQAKGNKPNCIEDNLCTRQRVA